MLSDLHKFVGFTTLAFNVVISITGAVLGLENLQRFSPAAKAILHPAPSAADRKSRPESVEDRLTIDEAVAAAQTAMPGFAPSTVQLPRPKRNHWMLRGNINGFFASKDTSWIILETETGQVIAKQDARNAQFLTKAYNVSEPLHFGDFGGIPLQALYALLGICSSSLTITGCGIWLYKNVIKSPKQPIRDKSAAVI